MKFSHILVPTLETFSHPLYSPFLEGHFSSRVYDFIIILKMGLCNSASVKITWGVSGRCRHPATSLGRYYNKALRIICPGLLVFFNVGFLQSQFFHFWDSIHSFKIISHSNIKSFSCYVTSMLVDLIEWIGMKNTTATLLTFLV